MKYESLSEDRRQQLYGYAIANYDSLDVWKKRKARKKFKVLLRDKGISMEEAWYDYTVGDLQDMYEERYGFSTLPAAPVAIPTPNLSKEKENTMYEAKATMNVAAIPARTPEQEAKDYLSFRLSGLYLEKEDDLRRKFGLWNDNTPNTPLELVERIKSGKYVIPDKDYNNEDLCYGCPIDEIIWRDPAVKKDREGFEKARKALQEASLATKDQIMVLGAEEGFKSFQKFEGLKQ